MLFSGIENLRAYIEMQKAPTRGHQGLSDEMSQPNNLITCKIQPEGKRKIVTNMTIYFRLRIQVLILDLQSFSDLAYFIEPQKG